MFQALSVFSGRSTRAAAEQVGGVSLHELRAPADKSLLQTTPSGCNEVYVDIAEQALAQMQPMMAQCPLGFGQWLQALAYALSPPRETAIVGDPSSADTRALLSVVRDGYRPFQVVALGGPSARPSDVPLVQNRGLMNGQAAAYACRAFVCQAAVEELEGLLAQLTGGELEQHPPMATRRAWESDRLRGKGLQDTPANC